MSAGVLVREVVAAAVEAEEEVEEEGRPENQRMEAAAAVEALLPK